MDFTIDDLFLILAPNVEQAVSHNDSFIKEEDDESGIEYDPRNMFNIFENQLKLKNRDSPLSKL